MVRVSAVAAAAAIEPMATQSKNTIYAEIGRRMRAIPVLRSDSSHEWDELVEKMCDSHDDGLRAIGIRELGILQQLCPHCPVFNRHMPSEKNSI